MDMQKIIRNTKHSMVIAASLLTLAGCTTESWYHGAKSAQTTHCMKEPISEYEDCIKQTGEDYESYQSYKEKREQLLEENQPEKAD